MSQDYIVTATGTEVGKTIFSASLAYHKNMHYFKPIQSGTPSDSAFMQTYFPEVVCLDPMYSFTDAIPPHIAAQNAGITIDLNTIPKPKFTLDHTYPSASILIEGAGGVLTPINSTQTMADLFVYFNLPVILVCSKHLGTINHTLLSLEALKNRRLNVAAVVMMGCDHVAQSYLNTIQSYTSSPCFAMPYFDEKDMQKLSETLKKEPMNFLESF